MMSFSLWHRLAPPGWVQRHAHLTESSSLARHPATVKHLGSHTVLVYNCLDDSQNTTALNPLCTGELQGWHLRILQKTEQGSQVPAVQRGIKGSWPQTLNPKSPSS